MLISKIIWQTPEGFVTDFDLEFLKCVLFKNVETIFCFDNAKLNVNDEASMVVYSCNQPEISQEFKAYLHSVKNYSLCHLSNESLNHNCSYYRDARIVLRSYFDPVVKNKNIFFIPLGFKTGFYNYNNDVTPLSERHFVWSFVGQLKNHRKEMVEVMKSLSPYFTHFNSRWNSSDQLSVNEVASIYKKTVFVPCPFGSVNPDSFRIMECLEWGCIPIVIKYKGVDYYKFIFGDHPFIIGDTWENAKMQMQTLLNDQNCLKQKMDEVIVWYKKFKDDLSYDVKMIVEGKFHKLCSKQFYYQEKRDGSFYMKYIFWKDFYFRKTKVSKLYRRAENRISKALKREK